MTGRTPRTHNTQASASGKAEGAPDQWIASRIWSNSDVPQDVAAGLGREIAANFNLNPDGGEAVHSQPLDQAPAEPPSSSNTEG